LAFPAAKVIPDRFHELAFMNVHPDSAGFFFGLNRESAIGE
jgi:hypothetical protein